MSQVFISYAKEDASTAEMLSKALQHAGFSVWWDRHIPPGKTWDEVIGREIDAAVCILVLWSKASIESRWVREEADRAARRNCLIPVLIEKVSPPFGFGRLEAADLSEWRGDEAYPEFVNLRTAVSDLVKGDAGRERNPAPSGPPKPIPVPPSRLPWIAACAVLALAVGIFVIVYPPRAQTQEQSLLLSVRAAPPAVPVGHRTTIVVRVVDRAGAPVQGATVVVSAGGGKFLRPGEAFDPHSTLKSPYESTGLTDPNGTYATGWVCNPCAGGYRMSAKATKPGFLDAKADFEVRISAQPQPEEQSLRLSARAGPPAVSVGQRTTIVVRVMDRAGAAVQGATVVVSAGGGKFLRPGESFDPRGNLQSPYESTGLTDPNGNYVAGWVCNPCAGGYGMSAKATKPGFLDAQEDFNVGISAQPQPEQQPLRLSVRVAPPTVPVGERTTIVVRVMDRAGAPVQGATVIVSAGGGKFLRPGEAFDPHSTLQSPYESTGLTDPNGTYATGWVCNPCAGGYGMSAKATKPGFLDAQDDLHVEIRH